jgi:hypothetical protein
MGESNPIRVALRSWREKRFAAAECSKLLALYQAVSSHESGHSRQDAYGEVVMAHTGCDVAQARLTLAHAAENYASWPVSRDLKFRDVVHFVIASRLLDISGKGSIQVDLKHVVSARIPSSL